MANMNIMKWLKEAFLFGFGISLLVWFVNLVVGIIPYAQNYAAVDFGSLGALMTPAGQAVAVPILLNYVIGAIIFGLVAMKLVIPYVFKKFLKMDFGA